MQLGLLMEFQVNKASLKVPNHVILGAPHLSLYSVFTSHVVN